MTRNASPPSADPWAITVYFNPLRWRRRLENYRNFRRHLTVPLLAVELGYDGRFELGPDDADVLIQLPGRDVLWQKERLLNLALAALPAEVERVACLDSDVILGRADWPAAACRLLEDYPLIHLYSEVYYLPEDHPPVVPGPDSSLPRVAGAAYLRARGQTPLTICQGSPDPSSSLPPVVYGMAWAFRRELFARHGWYDAFIMGGATRATCYAAFGLHEQAPASFQFNEPMRRYYLNWAEPFYRAVQGRWGYLPGPLAHLWHGDLVRRGYRRRYQLLARFDFDPFEDIALDEHGIWRWNSAKPELHQAVHDFFASRQEDGENESVASHLLGP